MLSGEVVKGKQIGKSLGYPTANLSLKKIIKSHPKKVFMWSVSNKRYKPIMA